MCCQPLLSAGGAQQFAAWCQHGSGQALGRFRAVLAGAGRDQPHLEHKRCRGHGRGAWWLPAHRWAASLLAAELCCTPRGARARAGHSRTRRSPWCQQSPALPDLAFTWLCMMESSRAKSPVLLLESTCLSQAGRAAASSWCCAEERRAVDDVGHF